MNYFAYGSNLWPARLSARVGLCRVVGVATVDGWTLTFGKKGGDGSAKCDAQFTGNSDDRLFGVIYEIHASQRKDLDVFEGLGYGYNIQDIEVTRYQSPPAHVHTDEATVSAALQAQTYVAIADHEFRQLQHSSTPVLPYTWYHQYVLQGAIHHGFPGQAIEQIRNQSHQPDPDPARHNQNATILSLTLTEAANLAGTAHAT